MNIKSSVTQVLKMIPPHVTVVAAAKTRTPDEVKAAVVSGIGVLGYNYLQEAERMYPYIGKQVQWHLIGHLQKNKVKKAVQLFDMIETIDSLELAELVDRHCATIGKVMPVLIEVNSGREDNKSGVFPEQTLELIMKINQFPFLKVLGLMTMGPLFDAPEAYRPLFKEMKSLFDEISRRDVPSIEMRFLSMGMSDSYEVAIEEGANIVRIGTKLFGPRR